jgi:hypothetical protein
VMGSSVAMASVRIRDLDSPFTGADASKFGTGG